MRFGRWTPLILGMLLLQCAKSELDVGTGGGMNPPAAAPKQAELAVPPGERDAEALQAYVPAAEADLGYGSAPGAMPTGAASGDFNSGADMPGESGPKGMAPGGGVPGGVPSAPDSPKPAAPLPIEKPTAIAGEDVQNPEPGTCSPVLTQCGKDSAGAAVCCSAKSDCAQDGKSCRSSGNRCSVASYPCGDVCCPMSQTCNAYVDKGGITRGQCIGRCKLGLAECSSFFNGKPMCCEAGQQCLVSVIDPNKFKDLKDGEMPEDLKGIVGSSCFTPPKASRCKAPQFACTITGGDPMAALPQTACCNPGTVCSKSGAQVGCCPPGTGPDPDKPGGCKGRGVKCGEQNCGSGDLCCAPNKKFPRKFCTPDVGPDSCERAIPALPIEMPK